MEGTRTVNLTPSIAVAAADMVLKTGLGTVDSIIYATTQHYDRELMTGDHHL